MNPEAWAEVQRWAPIVSPLAVGVLVYFLNRQTHTMVNSRLTQLLLANSRADVAEGTAAGRAAGGIDAAAVKLMIEEALAKAAAAPPQVTPETLAAVISERPAVVAVALTGMASDVVAKLNERGTG